MKKIVLKLALIMMLAVVVSDCKKNSSTPTSTVGLSMTSKTVAFNDYGNFWVHVTSTANWTATCNQTWCNVFPPSGANKDSIMIYLTGNSGTVNRTATITVSATGENPATLTITQTAAATSMVCTGKSGSNSYFPITTGNQWVYGYNYYSGAPGYPTYTVGATTVISGVTYYQVKYDDGTGFSSPTTLDFRTDAVTNNVYVRSGGTDQLLIPGSPTVGQSLGADPIGVADARTVVSTNASITTPTCTYSGCIKVEDFSSGSHLDYSYFKKGLGFIYNDNDYNLTSATIN
jgi:hypothetical protein